MNWYNAESLIRPEEEDITSSSVYNYLRRNIREVTEEEDGVTVTKYVYEECRILKESWGMYEQMLQQQADIDFLNMLTEDL